MADQIDVEKTYRRYGPLVLRRCRFLLRDEAQAADALQDVFVQFLRSQPRLHDEALGGLLYRMATNICLNRIRQRRRHPEELASDDLLMRLANLEEPESRNLAARVLEKLWGTQLQSTRLIATMHLLDGLTLEQVARELNLSVSGVRKRLRALRTKLAELEGV